MGTCQQRTKVVGLRQALERVELCVQSWRPGRVVKERVDQQQVPQRSTVRAHLRRSRDCGAGLEEILAAHAIERESQHGQRRRGDAQRDFAIDVRTERGKRAFDVVGHAFDTLAAFGGQHQPGGEAEQVERRSLAADPSHPLDALRTLFESAMGLSVEERALDQPACGNIETQVVAFVGEARFGRQPFGAGETQIFELERVAAPEMRPAGRRLGAACVGQRVAQAAQALTLQQALAVRAVGEHRTRRVGQPRCGCDAQLGSSCRHRRRLKLRTRKSYTSVARAERSTWAIRSQSVTSTIASRHVRRCGLGHCSL